MSIKTMDIVEGMSLAVDISIILQTLISSIKAAQDKGSDQIVIERDESFTELEAAIAAKKAREGKADESSTG